MARRLEGRGYAAQREPDYHDPAQQVSLCVAPDPGLQSHGLYAALIRDAPWLASEPRQLDGAQVAAVADPVAVSRAWALQLLLDAPDLSPPDPEAAPLWVQDHAPWLARFWGDDLKKAHRLTLNQAVLNWSRTDPEGLLAAARKIAANKSIDQDQGAQRLLELLTAETNPNGRRIRRDLLDQLLEARPAPWSRPSRLSTTTGI